MLDLDYLKANGGFVGPPVLKEIEWTSGGETHKANVYVVPRNYAVLVAESKASQLGTDILVSRIAASIVNEKGIPIFTPEIITGIPDTLNEAGEIVTPGTGSMCDSLFLALATAMNAVNGFTGEGEEKK